MAGKTFAQMTPEERAECGRKGGIKSGEAKRKKKQFKETLECFLDMPLKKGKRTDIEEVQNFAGLKGKNITVQEAMGIALMQRALQGDKAAIELVIAITGEKPAEKVEMSGTINNPFADLTTEQLERLASGND